MPSALYLQENKHVAGSSVGTGALNLLTPKP